MDIKMIKITVTNVKYYYGAVDILCEYCHEEVMNFGNVYRECNLPRCSIYNRFTSDLIQS